MIILTLITSLEKSPERAIEEYDRRMEGQSHKNMKNRMNLPIALLLLLGSLCAEVQGQAALTVYASKDLKEPIVTINGPIPTEAPVNFKVNAALASMELSEGYLLIIHNCDSAKVKDMLVITGPDRMPDVMERCRSAGLEVDSESGVCADLALDPPLEFHPFPEH